MQRIFWTSCLVLLCTGATIFAQQSTIDLASPERENVARVCLDYIEGFYEGDTVKLTRSIKPSLYKFGYWKNKTAGNYESDGQMTFEQAIKYANNVRAKQKFAKADAPKKVEVLDVMNHIATAKVTAWWGVDYILLSKSSTKKNSSEKNSSAWIIEQVLWEGPLEQQQTAASK